MTRTVVQGGGVIAARGLESTLIIADSVWTDINNVDQYAYLPSMSFGKQI